MSIRIRPCHARDLGELTELTIATFRPSYEDHFRPLMGEAIFSHQHGQWADDYRARVPALHDPASGKHVAVAEAPDGTIAGYVAWTIDPQRRHGEIVLLAVAEAFRRHHIGRTLCEHAFGDLASRGAEVVQIGTGGSDAFHAPARALYEGLGCVPVHVAYYLRQLGDPAAQ
jgi:ribosomal protein S18 acetylase RimI-like enzyme